MNKYCRIDQIRQLALRRRNKRAYRWAELRGLETLSCADLP